MWGVYAKMAGRLPHVLDRAGRFNVLFPVVTCIVLSIVLSLLFSIFSISSWALISYTGRGRFSATD
jgi:hypothetical protein